MKTSDLVRQLKCIYFDKELSEKCRHKVVGTDHDLLVQQMIEHATEKHPDLTVNKQALYERLEPVDEE